MTGVAPGAPPRLEFDRVSALQPRNSRAGSHAPGGLVREVRFALDPGRCLALLGDDQSGGSLLLDIAAGHCRPSSGQVRLDGITLDAQTVRRRRLGMVSPRDPLFPHLSVRGNVAFALRARRCSLPERRRRVDEALALLGLEEHADQRPSALDDAVASRAAIARALVADPAALLLDNPFARLGPAPREALQRTLRRLIRARDLTVLMRTDDRDEALLLGDEIGILGDGVLHQVGTASALLDRPASPVVAQRFGDANLLTGRVIDIDDEVATIRLSSGHEMTAEPDRRLEDGALCVLCIRPERIAVAFVTRPGLELGTDALPATLLEAIQFGDHVRLRFRLEDGFELLVRRPPAAIAGDLRPGRPALLAWQAHQARVFAAPFG